LRHRPLLFFAKPRPAVRLRHPTLRSISFRAESRS
jgi:hypothetical protein